MHITIRTIPHAQQRWPMVGDWTHSRKPAGDPSTSAQDLMISVSKMSDPHHEQLVALHEVVEALLCTWCGVSQETVDAWDKAHLDDPSTSAQEPGDNPASPYHRQHVVASVVERLAAELLGINWSTYEEEIDKLDGTK